MHTIRDNFGYRQVGTPGTWSAAVNYGTWIDIRGAGKASFVLNVAAVGTNLAAEVVQASDAEGTGVKSLTDPITATVVASTDNSRLSVFEVEEADLDPLFPFVTLKLTPGATTVLSVSAFIGEGRYVPFDNGTAEGVARVVSN